MSVDGPENYSRLGTLARSVDDLVLWEPDIVLGFVNRDPQYSRFFDRAFQGTASVTFQVLAEVMASLRLRMRDPDQLSLAYSDLTRFEVILPCLESVDEYSKAFEQRRRALPGEPPLKLWMYWQCAIVRLEKYQSVRILTKDRSVYGSLLPDSKFVPMSTMR